MGTREDLEMARSSGALVGALGLGLGLMIVGTPARATGFYDESYDGPVLVDDRPVVVRNTRAIRRRLAASRGVIVEPRYSSFHHLRRRDCRSNFGPY